MEVGVGVTETGGVELGLAPSEGVIDEEIDVDDVNDTDNDTDADSDVDNDVLLVTDSDCDAVLVLPLSMKQPG